MESRNLDQLSLKVLMTRQITLRVYNRASSWLPARTAQVTSSGQHVVAGDWYRMPNYGIPAP